MKTVFIEPDVESFDDFHDQRWFLELLNLAKKSAVSSQVEEFAIHWWATARAFMLPRLLVDAVFDVVHEFVPSDQRVKQDYWDEYLERKEFNAALWKVAEGAYTSIYYAYETLVIDLLNRRREPPVRVNDRQFLVVLNDELGAALANRTWNDSFVAVSREIRNCIVHRGGRASPRLSRMRPLPRIDHHNILISPGDVRRLYDDLKPRALSLVQHYCHQRN
jgi:hypothetical protein